MTENKHISLIDRLNLNQEMGNYVPPSLPPLIGNVPYRDPNSFITSSTHTPGDSTERRTEDDLNDLFNYLSTPTPSDGRNLGGGRLTTVGRSTDDRYKHFMPGNWDNEDAYARHQSWTTKAFNGITKAIALTGTTFLQTTIGTLNGVIQGFNDGRLASFYDNEFNRTIDNYLSDLENKLPSYETKEFRDSSWYSPDYWMTGNFLWEGVVKNLGFAAGAALSGAAFTPIVATAGSFTASAFSRLPAAARLMSVGKAAEAAKIAQSAVTGASNLGKTKKISDSFLATYNSLDRGQRAVVAGLSTTGEAAIESYQNLNEWRDNAIRIYTEQEGYAPTGEALAEINEMADGVGNYTMLGNVIALSAGNFVQFPKILGSSYRAEKGIVNNLRHNIRDIKKVDGSFTASIGNKTFRRVRRAVANPYLFSYVEALEEGSQFAIGKATEDYFNKKYKNEDHYWYESLYEGYKQTFGTDDGMKEVLIGGISGALMTSKGKIEKSMAISKNTSAAIRSFNENPLSKFTKDTKDAVIRGTNLQEERNAYIEEGDILGAEDTEHDYIVNYLAPRIKYGRLDLVFADIKEYREVASTKEGFEQLRAEGKVEEGDTQQEYLDRLNRFESTVHNVNSLYQSINLRYGGLRDAKGKKVYNDKVTDLLVYASSKIADYDIRYKRMSSKILHPSIDLDRLSQEAIDGNDSGLLEAEMNIMADTSMNETQKEELIEDMYNAVNIMYRRSNFTKEYNDIVKNPGKYSGESFESNTETKNTSEPKVDPETGEIINEVSEETVEVNTASGTRTVSLGKEYYVLPPVVYDEDNLEASTRTEQVITILGKNEDGTFQIRDATGAIRNITEKQLAAFNLGTKENTDSSKKARFLLQHLNTVFEHYNIKDKDGKPVQGRLEYSFKKDKLIFVYKDKKGKVRRKEVTNSMFIPKEGYKGAMVRAVGEVSVKQREALEALQQEKVTIEERLKRRFEVLEELFNNNLKSIEKINKVIDSKKNRLANIDKELRDASLTKAGKPRKRFTTSVRKLIKEVSELKDTLPEEIERLESQRHDLESEQEVLKSYMEDVTDMPESAEDFLKIIKDDIDNIEDAIDYTKKAVKDAETLLDRALKLYDKAINLLADYVRRLAEENPGIPLNLEAFRDTLEKHLTPEGARQIIDNKQGFTNQVLELENEILQFEGELDIVNIKKELDAAKKLADSIPEMLETLDSLIEKQIGTQKIFELFQDLFEKEKNEIQAADKLRDNAVINLTIERTQDTQAEVAPFDPNYRPVAKKDDLIVPTASVGVMSDADHHVRANKFGFNFYKMKEEGKEIKAVYVTQKTEDSLGLSGLTEKLKQDGVKKDDQGRDIEVDTESTIALVMVVETENGYVPVDVEGNPITEGDILNEAIYQVMPLGKLSWLRTVSDSKQVTESMFREDNEVTAAITEKYKEWREDVLSRDEIDSSFSPDASFGFLSYERDANNKINYDQRTSMHDAGFIEDEQVLTGDIFIKIPTTEDVVVSGTTVFQKPFKRVLFDTGNGFVMLQNKQHTPESAETIYNAILTLAKELVNGKEGINTIKSKRILDYLKGVVYWGRPTYRTGENKPIGYSSVFFSKNDVTGFPQLHIGRDMEVEFTPNGLKNAKSEVIEKLQELYTNTNNSKINEGIEFEEILAIDENGEITDYRIWPNYQSYLLSSKLPSDNGKYISDKPRKDGDIPLTTMAKPITESEPINRKGIYFYNPSLEENYRIAPKPRVTFQAPSAAPAGPVAGSTSSPTETGSTVQTPKPPQAPTQSTVPAITDQEIVNTINSMSQATKATLEKITDLAKRMEGYKIAYINHFLREAIAKSVNVVAIPKGAKKTNIINAQAKMWIAKAQEESTTLDEMIVRIRQALQDAYDREYEMANKVITYAFDPVTGELVETTENTESIENVVEEVAEEADDGNGVVIENAPKIAPNTEVGEAAESAVANPVEPGEPVSGPDVKEMPKKPRRPRGNRNAYRTRLKRKQDVYKKEDWSKVEAWLKKNFRGVPLHRMKTILRNTNGDQMWGMFKDSAMFVYRSAEEGTVYHEVFEAVWAMFTSADERADIVHEFMSREGVFIDRPTGMVTKYSEATLEEVREQLAEEFRAFVLQRDSVIKKGKNFILKMFSDFKRFVLNMLYKLTGNTNNIQNVSDKNINTLFKNINRGKYSKMTPQGHKLVQASYKIIDSDEIIVTDDAAFRERVEDLSDTIVYEMVDEMLYATLSKLVETDTDLFKNKTLEVTDEVLQASVLDALGFLKEDSQDAFEDGDIDQQTLEEELYTVEYYEEAFKTNFDLIKKKFNDRLKSFEITVDENDADQRNDENKTRNSDYVDATKVDLLRRMNGAMKLLFSTVPRVFVEDDGAGGQREFLDMSSIGGIKTLTYKEVTNTLMKTLRNSRNLDEMIEKFRQLAVSDPNYRKLYSRITKSNYTQENVSYSNIDSIQGFRLLSGLWKTFSLHAPVVKNVFILEGGVVEVGDAALSSQANQLRAEFMQTITLYSKSDKGFFTYSSDSGGVYKVNLPRMRMFPLGKDLQDYSNYLNELGVEFSLEEMNKLTGNQIKHLRTVVSGIRSSIQGIDNIKTFSAKSLDFSSRLLNLALLKASATNPSFESTYFNVAGERTQTFINGNSPSRLFRELSQITNIRQLEGTEYEYLIPGKDVFTEHSVILSEMFYLDDRDSPNYGNRKQISVDERYLEVGYVGGTMDEVSNKNVPSSQLTFRERFTQELNLNLRGWYMNLVPGDSSTEWMTYMGNYISESSLGRGYKEVNDVFKGYFISELNLSREDGRDVYIHPSEKDMDPKKRKKSRNPKDLRFLQGMLDKSVTSKLNRTTRDASEIYEANKVSIENSFKRVIEERTEQLIDALIKYELIIPQLENTSLVDIPSLGIKDKTMEEINLTLKTMTVNYMINNIEMHKMMYGDPFQYKDALKRFKSFQSPRQELVNSSYKFNALKNRIWNKGFKVNSPGLTDFTKNYFSTFTIDDVRIASEFKGYNGLEETDGAGIILLRAHRHFKILSSDWTDQNEEQYRYEIKWEELEKQGKRKEADALKNPQVRSTFTSSKPVVTGNRTNDGTNNKTVLDKYSLYPMSYRIMKQMDAKNGVALYNKMSRENLDYGIFHSGRKVGAYNTVEAYDKEGNFIDTPVPPEARIDIPFSIIGLQVEVPSDESSQTTRGSQVTKIITMNRMDAGVPIDFMPVQEDQSFDDVFAARYESWSKLSEEQKRDKSPLYSEVTDNKKLLDALANYGYQTLLDKLGIVEGADGKPVIEDFEKTVELIKDEVLLRDTNENIIDALNTFMNGSTVLEATSAYRQVSNILYSIVDKNIVHPKISGSMKVQIPGTFWEQNRLAVTKINGKEGYTSDTLKFYKKGENGAATNTMEIMVSRWFKSDMSDEKLLEYLNTTKEGQKILKGFAFRIPTQNMNSVDAFVIKKFLPEEFGDSVIVPSEIVGKVGSDFDIDKLSLYFKNVFRDYDGKPVLVPYFGIGEKARGDALAFASDYYDKLLKRSKKKLKSNQNLTTTLNQMTNGKLDAFSYEKWDNIFAEWFYDDVNDARIPLHEVRNIFKRRAYNLNKTIQELTENESLAILIEFTGDRLYKQGLENAYIESNINLLTKASNYENLVTPNSAASMEEISKKIYSKRGNPVLEYSNPVNMTDRLFMTRLRQDFVEGKQAIGVAANSQTNNSLNQKHPVVILDENIELAPKDEKDFLDTGEINFKNYNKIFYEGKIRPTLSFIKNQAGEYISDILSMFVDGYVDISNGPWIMHMGARPATAGTWMFLVKLGIPIKEVAYFMNQPIIVDYLQLLENRGYSWLFSPTMVELIKNDPKYLSQEKTSLKNIPGENELFRTIGTTDLTDKEKSDQQYYLDEFLKYSMMARHSFYVTQGTNYDTATFNNGYLLYKKSMQIERALTSVISGVDDMLENSHLGTLRTKLTDSREVISEVLVSDNENVRNIVHKILEPYIDLSDKDFVTMAQKVVTNLFDYTMQTHTDMSRYITETLTKKGNAVQKINKFVKDIRANKDHDLYHNEVIKMIEILPATTAELGSTDNIRIKARTSEVFEQNKMIHAFREIKEYLNENTDIYDSLLRVAILQSGLGTSTISFTSSIPFEDFNDFYNEALSTLDGKVDLDVFNELSMFARNNWNNNQIVPYNRATWGQTRRGKVYNMGMAFLPDGVKHGVRNNKIPPVMTVSVGARSKVSHIVFTWEKQLELLPKEQRYINGKANYAGLNLLKKQMEAKGDYSYRHKVLMEKVLDENGEPFIHGYVGKDGPREFHVYKAINALGNGIRGNEFYDVAKQSVINNGFDKIIEKSDKAIVDFFRGNYNTNAINDPAFELTNVIPQQSPMAPETMNVPVRSSYQAPVIPNNSGISMVDISPGKVVYIPGRADTAQKTGNNNAPVAIAMSDNNVAKILNGTKTTTIRESIPKGGYINPGESKFAIFGGKKFIVTNKGKMTIEQAGGVKAMLKSEGVKKISDLMFEQSKAWFKGNGRMYVFDIAPAETSFVAPQQKSAQSAGSVEVVNRYSVQDVKNNPDKIYVFGDNMRKTGKGGQAIIRDEKNAFGIPTKNLPSRTEDAYFSDALYADNILAINLAVQNIVEDGRPVVFPKDGLGTGLAKLKEKAPKTFEYLNRRLMEEFGFDNNTGRLVRTQTNDFNDPFKNIPPTEEDNNNC